VIRRRSYDAAAVAFVLVAFVSVLSVAGLEGRPSRIGAPDPGHAEIAGRREHVGLLAR
jgi:hypothetical protein